MQIFELIELKIKKKNWENRNGDEKKNSIYN